MYISSKDYQYKRSSISGLTISGVISEASRISSGQMSGRPAHGYEAFWSIIYEWKNEIFFSKKEDIEYYEWTRHVSYSSIIIRATTRKKQW